MTLNLAQCFFQKAQQQPEHPLILGQECSDETSYAAFAAEVQTLSDQLTELGVKRGDNIGVHYLSGRHYIAFVYAVWRCGACVTPLPFELTATEKQQIFDFVHIDAVISSTRLSDQLNAVLESDTAPLPNQAIFAKAISHCQTPPDLTQVNAAFIRFTSGTTGDAKGVVLSHESIYERIQAANKVLNIGEKDRILWLLSMDYHFAVSIGAYLTLGASIILPKNSFGITLLTAAANHNATFIYGSPTHYSMMTQDDTGMVLPDALRLAIVTTTALHSDVADMFYQRFGRILNETYGIIELGLPAINVSQSREKQGSVGQITPDYELRLDCAEGQQHGEITVKGKGMLDAYYAPWRSREMILQQNGGWFKTGDLGKLDADGFLYIVGRSKEMISIGGMKFFPNEVEAVLEKHPAIQAACVFAVKSKQLAEPARAHLVLQQGESMPDAKALRTYCRQSLAAHKIPGQFEWVEQLAYTASGKKIRNPDKITASK
ncbi:class I adenylate-forming enzyme family protein [Candidatus Albibeggiatoa sp. nov. BB20]|uniref:class I adenylate-forming enzyme family protein n=1 Tax=Candidatus Albibeggiatoa sp. nov. BB20 TaxID=3162723 RepID=UPI003365702F